MARFLGSIMLSLLAVVGRATVISEGGSETYAFDFTDESTSPPHSGYTTWLLTDHTNASPRFQIEYFDEHGTYLGAWGPFALGNTSGPAVTGGNVFNSPWTTLKGTVTISVLSGSMEFREFGLCLDGTCGQVDQFVRGVPVPEPGTLSLFAAGLLALGFARQRKTRIKLNVARDG